MTKKAIWFWQGWYSLYIVIAFALRANAYEDYRKGDTFGHSMKYVWLSSAPADLKHWVSYMVEEILSERFATSCGGLIIFSPVSKTSVACNDCGSLFQKGAHLACVLICNESCFWNVVHPNRVNCFTGIVSECCSFLLLCCKCTSLQYFSSNRCQQLASDVWFPAIQRHPWLPQTCHGRHGAFLRAHSHSDKDSRVG